MPDTYAGAFQLIGINLTMVFVVLAALAGIINITRWVLSRHQPLERKDTALDREKRVTVLTGSHSDLQKETTLPPDKVSATMKAAMMAAVAAHMSSSQPPAFQRTAARGGVWGRQSGRGPGGGLGTYRSAAAAHRSWPTRAGRNQV